MLYMGQENQYLNKCYKFKSIVAIGIIKAANVHNRYLIEK